MISEAIWVRLREVLRSALVGPDERVDVALGFIKLGVEMLDLEAFEDSPLEVLRAIAFLAAGVLEADRAIRGNQGRAMGRMQIALHLIDGGRVG